MARTALSPRVQRSRFACAASYQRLPASARSEVPAPCGGQGPPARAPCDAAIPHRRPYRMDRRSKPTNDECQVVKLPVPSLFRQIREDNERQPSSAIDPMPTQTGNYEHVSSLQVAMPDIFTIFEGVGSRTPDPKLATAIAGRGPSRRQPSQCR
jgi:hypothetical protein